MTISRMNKFASFALLLCVILLASQELFVSAESKEKPKKKQAGADPADIDLDYTNNFYVLLSSSTFYFNYRHTGNALMIYKYLKARGIHDDRILLMLPENHACNARNKFKGRIYVNNDHDENFYCDDVEVDYKSDDLTFEAILNLFRGRYDPNFPESKKLKTNAESKIFVYMNGHGGENFFKIQDTEVL